MNRKLLVLDVVLGAGVIFGGFQLHSQWVAAKARQARMPGPPLKPAPAPPMSPLPQQPAVLPSDFKRVAIDTLFDPSRNPNVPVPVIVPPPPPPPREPPPLPSFHGLMDLGTGPFALMTESGRSGYQEVHAGEMIGPFKLLSFNRKEFEVEWEGKVIHRRSDEGKDERPKASPQSAAAAAAADALKPTIGIIPGQAPPDAPPAPEPQGQQLGPGAQMTDTMRACQVGDSTPEGTTSGGYKKEVNRSPLGSTQCVWRAVGK